MHRRSRRSRRTSRRHRGRGRRSVPPTPLGHGREGQVYSRQTTPGRPPDRARAPPRATRRVGKPPPALPRRAPPASLSSPTLALSAPCPTCRRRKIHPPRSVFAVTLVPSLMEPIRIVSYNVRYFGHVTRGLASTRAGKRSIARTLASLRPLPDVVCLQQVETSSIRSNIGRPRARQDETQLESFMGYLAQNFHEAGMEMPYDALYFRAHAYTLAEVPPHPTGPAILVNRYTLRIDEHNADQPYGITYFRVARWKDRKQSRICAHIKVRDLQGRGLHVFNTHLSLPTPFAREYWAIKDKMGWGFNQIQEARRLAAFIRDRAGDEPFVVCGDFNSQPASPVFQFLHRDMGLVAPQVEFGQVDLSRPRAFPTDRKSVV